MKQKLTALLSALLLVALCLPGTACGEKGQKNLGTPVEHELALPQKTAYASDYSAFPRPAGETKKTVNYIDITGCNYFDLFYAITLQGIVNRENPDLYLIHDWIVQAADGSFNASKYWFDKLDESYLDEAGEPYFEKVRFTDLKQLLLHYYDSVRGAVLYHDRIVTRNVVASQNNASSIFGDMSVLNLTTMMCAQYDALPMTESLLVEVNAFLVEQGKEPLKVLADSRELMEKNPDGSYVADTSSRAVWMACNRYALDKAKNGEWTFSDAAIGHNGTFNAAWYDYVVAHKLFTYSRVTAARATAEEAAVEEEIMALTKVNSPVMGVFHLGDGGDEEEYVRYVNNHGKYFNVTHETWDLSWTAGLPRVEAQGKEEKLTYDPDKVYIAMTFSESDNNSYTNFKMPLQYDSDYRGTFRMTWALNQACVDLNPNIISYLNATMKPGDGFATGEAGIGYIRNERVLDAYKSDFFGLTDLYAARLGNGCIRTLLNEPLSAMEYILYMDDIESVLSGYSGVSAAGTTEYNSGLANYYFHGKPIFQNFCGISAPDALLDVHAAPGSFLSFGLYGWAGDLGDIYKVVSRLPENYEVVTQKQLADLYSQKMSKVFEKVTEADFQTCMTEGELGFLYHSDNYANYQTALVEGQESYRYGSRENELVYAFDLDADVESGTFSLLTSGEVLLECSTDAKNWYRMGGYDIPEGSTNYDEKRELSFELPAEMAGKKVYLRVSDPTPEDGVGYKLFRLTLTTDRSGNAAAYGFTTDQDAAYYVSGARGESGWRTGETVYRLPFAEGVRAANVSVLADAAVKMEISADGKRFFPIAVNTFDRSAYDGYDSYYYGLVDSIVPALYLRLTASGSLKEVRVTPVQTTAGFDYSPCGNDFDRASVVLGWNENKITDGLNSAVRVGNTGVFMNLFRLDAAAAKPVLTVRAAGFFKLEISADGKTFTTLRAVAAGENVDSELVFDISAYAKPDSLFYLRFTKSTAAGGFATLYNVRLSLA